MQSPSADALRELAAAADLVRAIVRAMLDAESKDLDRVIGGGLAALGNRFDVDRAHVFLLDAAGELRNTHQWCRSGVAPSVDVDGDLPVASITPWLERLSQGHAVSVEDARSLPADDPARIHMDRFPLRSMHAAPLTVRGELVGIFSITKLDRAHPLPAPQVGLFQTVADTMAAVLVHQRVGAAAATLERRLAALSRYSHDLIVVTDRSGVPIYRSSSWSAQVKAGGKLPWAELIHPDDLPMCLDLLDAVVEQGPGSWLATGDFRVQDREGNWIWISGTASNHFDDPAVGGLVLNTQDVTDRKRTEAQLAHDALHDPLTGLGNLALFNERLQDACDRVADRGGGLGVLLLDLDRFKLINDSKGHATGDMLLRAFAQRLQEIVGPADTIARFGGDEFLLLTEAVSTELELQTMADHLRHGFVRPLLVGPHRVHVTASIGLAFGEGPDLTVGRLIADADTAMYRAKKAGRNRVSVFDSQMRTDVMRRTDVLQRLQLAIDTQSVRPHYQPLVDMQTGEVIGAEALARWTDDQLGFVSPGEFIPLAEEAGMIATLTTQIFSHAVREVASWPSWMYVSVNLSAALLSSPGTAPGILDLMRDSGLAGPRLCVEVTETSVMENPRSAIRTLEQLRDVGIRTALDDFGTGYSSLGLLRNLPIDVLKIDRSFVTGVDGDPKDRRLVEAVTSLAEDFGMATLAEGVETVEQQLALQSIGCGAAQGYLFARPMPADEMRAAVNGAVASAG